MGPHPERHTQSQIRNHSSFGESAYALEKDVLGGPHPIPHVLELFMYLHAGLGQCSEPRAVRMDKFGISAAEATAAPAFKSHRRDLVLIEPCIECTFL